MCKKRIILILTVLCMISGMLSAPVMAADDRVFQDVDEDSWYAPYVNTLHRQGIIEGMDRDHFGPELSLTRAQLVTMLTPDLGEETMSEYSTRKKFSDVEAGTWYAPYVNWASEQGWVSGYEDGTFRPDQALTRAEASVILVQYMTTTENQLLRSAAEMTEEPADEEKIPAWAKEAVHKCLQTGLFRGYPDGTFGPSRAITRAEISAVLCRLYDLDIQGEDSEKESETVNDGITVRTYSILGLPVTTVCFDPKDGFTEDVVLANDQLYSSESASAMVSRSGAAIAVNGTYFNNSDLGILSSIVRDGQVIRIENTSSRNKPYFVVDTDGNISFQNMRVLQTVTLYRDGQPVPEAVLEEVGCNYKLPEDDGTRMVFTREYGETTPGRMKAAVVCDSAGTVMEVIDSEEGEEVAIPEEGFVICERVRRDAEYTTKWEVFFEEVTEGDVVDRTVFYEGSDVQNIRTAVCAGPTIVKDGVPCANAATYRAEGFSDSKVLYGFTQRIGLGVKEDGSVVLMSATATLYGMSLLMASAGCEKAINLDGGSSASLYVDGKALATPVRRLTHMIVFRRTGEDAEEEQ